MAGRGDLRPADVWVARVDSVVLLVVSGGSGIVKQAVRRVGPDVRQAVLQILVEANAPRALRLERERAVGARLAQLFRRLGDSPRVSLRVHNGVDGLRLAAVVDRLCVGQDVDLLLLFASGSRVDRLQDLHLGDARGALVAC